MTNKEGRTVIGYRKQKLPSRECNREWGLITWKTIRLDVNLRMNAKYKEGDVI